MNYKSVSFKVIHWGYEPTLIGSHEKRSDSYLHVKPLLAERDKRVVGLRYVWNLRLFIDNKDFFSYVSEEDYLTANHQSATIDILKGMAQEAYDKSKLELNFRNLSVGLDATFFDFQRYSIDYQLVLSYLQ